MKRSLYMISAVALVGAAAFFLRGRVHEPDVVPGGNQVGRDGNESAQATPDLLSLPNTQPLALREEVEPDLSYIALTPSAVSGPDLPSRFSLIIEGEEGKAPSVRAFSALGETLTFDTKNWPNSVRIRVTGDFIQSLDVLILSRPFPREMDIPVSHLGGLMVDLLEIEDSGRDVTIVREPGEDLGVVQQGGRWFVTHQAETRTFTNLEPGRYIVSADRLGGSDGTASNLSTETPHSSEYRYSVDVVAGEMALVSVPSFDRGVVRLRGHILSCTIPASGMVVSAYDAALDFEAECTTDADGLYTLDVPSNVERLSIVTTASGDAYGRHRLLHELRIERESASRVQVHDFRIPCGAIKGRVLFEAGVQPAERLRVERVSSEEIGRHSVSQAAVKIGDDGHYRIDGLTPGQYRVAPLATSGMLRESLPT